METQAADFLPRRAFFVGLGIATAVALALDSDHVFVCTVRSMRAACPRRRAGRGHTRSDGPAAARGAHARRPAHRAQSDAKDRQGPAEHGQCDRSTPRVGDSNRRRTRTAARRRSHGAGIGSPARLCLSHCRGTARTAQAQSGNRRRTRGSAGETECDRRPPLNYLVPKARENANLLLMQWDESSNKGSNRSARERKQSAVGSMFCCASWKRPALGRRMFSAAYSDGRLLFGGVQGQRLATWYGDIAMRRRMAIHNPPSHSVTQLHRPKRGRAVRPVVY